MSPPPDVSIHRYPTGAVLADYGRALVGMALTLGPLAVFNVVPVMVYILGALGALFLAFGFRTLLRHLTHVEVSSEGIRIERPAGGAIRWQQLDAMSLRYYATRRDKMGGWMQLKIKGDGRAVTLDSALVGFNDIVRRALRATDDNGVQLDSRTLANLPSLGVVPFDGAGPAADGR